MTRAVLGSVLLALVVPGCFVGKDLRDRVEDGDGDEVGLGEDCDPADPTQGDSKTWYYDADGDGYGVTNNTTTTHSCSNAPSGFSALGDDCDDDLSAISPSADEVCDGVDNDCDGLTDGDDEDNIYPEWYIDSDGDGVGSTSDGTVSCEQGTGSSALSGDCDDEDDTISPYSHEICGDGVDQDCSGIADEDGSICDVDLECTGLKSCATSEFSLQDLCRCACDEELHMQFDIEGISDPLDDWYVGAVWEFETSVASTGALSCPEDFLAVDEEVLENFTSTPEDVNLRISSNCDAHSTDALAQWYENVESGYGDAHSASLVFLRSNGEEFQRWNLNVVVPTYLSQVPPCEGTTTLTLKVAGFQLG